MQAKDLDLLNKRVYISHVFSYFIQRKNVWYPVEFLFQGPAVKLRMIKFRK